LSYPRETQRWGERQRNLPSRFLDELPIAELQRDGADPVADAAHKQERASAGFAANRALLDA
jgi:ATP-dependent DNA helicase Rep